LKKDIVRHNFQLLDVAVQKLAVERFINDDVPDSPVGLIFTAEGKGDRIQNDSEEIGYSLLTVKLSFKEPNPKLFELELILKGTCESNAGESSSPEEFDKFLNQYALPLLWPYAREIVWSMLIRMGLPPIMLPAINVAKTVEASISIETE